MCVGERRCEQDLVVSGRGTVPSVCQKANGVESCCQCEAETWSGGGGEREEFIDHQHGAWPGDLDNKHSTHTEGKREVGHVPLDVRTD
jgi:hypothetical protein